MTSSAMAFGQRLAKTLGSGPSRSSLAMQEAAVALAARRSLGHRRKHWRSLRPWLFVGASALAITIITLGVGQWIRNATPEPGPVSTPSRVIATSARHTETLSLLDGSQVIVEPNSLAELQRDDSSWTAVALRHGRLDLSVSKRQHAHFEVAAGPYRVVVVGTRFKVAFDDESEKLSVSVSEGRVKVFGKGLPREGTAVAAGSNVELSAAERGASLQTPTPQPEASAVKPRVDEEASQEKLTRRAEAQKPRGDARASTWHEHAQRGRYREAYALADAQGFDMLVASLPAGALLVLANTARYAGHPARARQAFLQLRSRFGRQPASILASFYLARLALDNDRDLPSASHWFRTYLAEAPNGQLAAGARVDLMNILLQLGDRAGARGVAQDYLKHHPKGAHANAARSLLDGRTTSP